MAQSDVAADAELCSFVMRDEELSSGVHRATSVSLQFWVLPLAGKEKRDCCVLWHSSSSCFLCRITLFLPFSAFLFQCRDLWHSLPTALHFPNTWLSRNPPSVPKNLQFFAQLCCSPSRGGLHSASLAFFIGKLSYAESHLLFTSPDVPKFHGQQEALPQEQDLAVTTF